MRILQLVRKKLIQWLLRAVSLVLPKHKARELERWRRGREEFLKLRRVEYVVVSMAKSGRTWLRVMLSRYFQQMFDVPERIMLGFDNFHRHDHRVPPVFFTHDNYLKDYTGNRDSKRDFYDKKVVLLVRRPQDLAVSEYFHWKHRLRPHKIPLNRFPGTDKNLAIYDYVMDPEDGIIRIIEFMNLWAQELPRLDNVLLVRYEDLHAAPEQSLTHIVEFLGAGGNEAAVREAVEFASVENLRRLESRNYFWRSGSRLAPRDKNNQDSFKVRRAKVGGYRDYFDEQQIAAIDAFVDAELAPLFGYQTPAAQAAEASAVPETLEVR